MGRGALSQQSRRGWRARSFVCKGPKLGLIDIHSRCTQLIVPELRMLDTSASPMPAGYGELEQTHCCEISSKYRLPYPAWVCRKISSFGRAQDRVRPGQDVGCQREAETVSLRRADEAILNRG